MELVAPGRGRPHPLVGPQGAEGVAQEGDQRLVLPHTLSTGQQGARVHLNIQATTATPQEVNPNR